MPNLNALSNDALPQQYSFISTDSMRRRALARLYERRTAVDGLIDSLERYQCAQSANRAACVEISVGKKS